MNTAATTIFALAIIHTFLAARIAEQAKRMRHGVGREIVHFLGEVEVIFGLWVLPLIVAMTIASGWDASVHYLNDTVNYTEPLFVVVVMALASTRPIVALAESALRTLAGVGGATPGAWWVVILIVGPLLGSLITEPAAMTIAALLLGRQFYALKPSSRLAYATLGLLFVNISVGGTLTHFAAPPVLMVAGPWGWDTAFMATHFGWKAVIGILVSTGVYYAIFRRELAALEATRVPVARAAPERPVPAWITGVHLAFLGFTVLTAHFPPLFIGAFLFFLAFSQATAHHQGKLELKMPLLVGFFLAGLVVHGGLQGWWIEPVLTSLTEVPLFVGATLLTALNDNAAITYLATLVPDFTDELKYAVVAGAVTGGGLTVIANAPNPAGQSLLQRYFPEGVKPLGLLLGALLPTAILSLCFLLL